MYSLSLCSFFSLSSLSICCISIFSLIYKKGGAIAARVLRHGYPKGQHHAYVYPYRMQN